MHKDIAKFFDEFSDYEYRAFQLSEGVAFLGRFEEEFIREHVRGKICLDVGIGTGRLSSVVRGAGVKVVVMDISEKMAKQASEKGFDVVLGSADMLPFKENVFDMIVCVRVLKYVPDWKKAIHDAGKVLKRHGYYVVEVANSLSIAYFGKRNYKLFRIGEVERIIEENKMRVIEKRCGARLPFILYIHVPLWLLKPIEKFLGYLLPRCWLSRSVLLLAEKYED
jgi:ubiquinone/menaquinone biosynthesis C-methylase UbiE